MGNKKQKGDKNNHVSKDLLQQEFGQEQSTPKKNKKR